MRTVPLLCFTLAAACSASIAIAQPKTKTDPEFTKARAAVALKLKDPESARFEGLTRRTSPNTRGEPMQVVCGTVNAKNSFGGYGGPLPFTYFVADGSADIVTGSESQLLVARSIYRRFCLGQPD